MRLRFFFAFKLYGVCGNRRNSHINFTTILHWLILGCPPFPVRPKLRAKGSPTNHPDFWNPEHHFFHQTSILPWFLGSIHEKFRSGVSFVRRFRWVSLMQVHVIWVAWDGLDLVGALVQKNRPFWIEGLWSKLELINDSFLYYLEKWEFGPYLDDHSRTCKWLVNIIYCATGNLPCCLPSRFWRWQPAELNFCKMQQLHRRKLRRPVGSNCS